MPIIKTIVNSARLSVESVREKGPTSYAPPVDSVIVVLATCLDGTFGFGTALILAEL